MKLSQIEQDKYRGVYKLNQTRLGLRSRFVVRNIN